MKRTCNFFFSSPNSGPSLQKCLFVPFHYLGKKSPFWEFGLRIIPVMCFSKEKEIPGALVRSLTEDRWERTNTQRAPGKSHGSPPLPPPSEDVRAGSSSGSNLTCQEGGHTLHTSWSCCQVKPVHETNGPAGVHRGSSFVHHLCLLCKSRVILRTD